MKLVNFKFCITRKATKSPARDPVSSRAAISMGSLLMSCGAVCERETMRKSALGLLVRIEEIYFSTFIPLFLFPNFPWGAEEDEEEEEEEEVVEKSFSLAIFIAFISICPGIYFIVGN